MICYRLNKGRDLALSTHWSLRAGAIPFMLSVRGSCTIQTMPQAHIYQIFYSDVTRQEIDPGFIPLDNRANERPDWREYWPIRKFLLNEELDETTCYGFFSPKFKEKTNLGAEQVKHFIHAGNADVDVFIFSPFFDLSAFFLSIFEQGNSFHPGFTDLLKEFLAATNQDIDVSALLTDSSNTVYCNYFVAKPKFWRAWLAQCEMIFRIAEERATPLSEKLNADIGHEGALAPMKVFLLERIVSLILATQPHWNTCAANPFQISQSATHLSNFPMEAVISDALKIALKSQGYSNYRDAFFHLRKMITQSLRQPKS